MNGASGPDERGCISPACSGLAVGSFLNVVVWRVPRGESVVPRARTARDAATPSVHVTRSPCCRGCCWGGAAGTAGNPISARYPLVELLTAAVFVAIALRFHDRPVGSSRRTCTWRPRRGPGVDRSGRAKLPNALTLPAYLVGPVLLAVAVLSSDDGGWASLLRAPAGWRRCTPSTSCSGIVTSGRGMGFGDVKLAGVLGLFLAFLGWQTWAVGLFAGFFVGGVDRPRCSWPPGRPGRKTKVPYGPFMLVGALIALFVGKWHRALLPPRRRGLKT